MESLVPILIAVAFFILQAVVSSNKKKEAAQKRTAYRSEQPSYFSSQQASPPSEKSPFELLLQSLQAQGVVGNIEEAEAIDDNAEMTAEEPDVIEQQLYPTYKEAKATPAANIASAEMQAQLDSVNDTKSEEEKAAFATAAPATTPDWLQSFEVEKAVVYSEILQPKFNS
jgi:hypothetical protein